MDDSRILAAHEDRGGAYESPAFGAADLWAHFSALVALLRERRWFIILVVAAAVVLAVAVLRTMPPVYTAQSVIMVGPRTQKVVDLSPVISSLDLNPLSLQPQVETEMQIIKSRRLALRLIEQLNLLEDPEWNPRLAPTWVELLPDWIPEQARAAAQAMQDALGPRQEVSREAEIDGIIDQLDRRILVEPVGRSVVVAVSVPSSDPAKAARMADAMAELYVESTVQRKAAGNERANAALAERIAQLREKVNAAEDAVEKYRISARLFDGDTRGGTPQQLTEIRSQLTAAQAQVATASARLSETLRARGSLSSAPDVLGSQIIQRLREQEVILQREIEEKSKRFGDRHPEVIWQRSALGAVQRQINAEIDKIAASLSTEVQMARAREQMLRESLAAIEHQAGERNLSEIRLRELKREAEANRSLYELFLRRQQEVNEQHGLQQPDAEILSYAALPLKPSWPPKLLFIGLAAITSSIGASFFVVARELMRGGVRNPEEVYNALNLRTLGLVPRLTAVQRMRKAPESYLLERPTSAYGESIQLLRMMLRREAGKVVLFTSSISGEGKTAVAVSCARMAARGGERAIIVECDMRHPRIEAILGRTQHGLPDILAGRCALHEATGTDQSTGLAYIASRSSRAASPADLLSGQAMTLLVERLAESYDLVVLDTPPVLAVPDALALAVLADSTLFVVDAGRTPLRLVRLALDRLAQARAAVCGIILSKTKRQYATQYRYEDNSAGRRASALQG